MRRQPPLQLLQLEEREVPSASLVTGLTLPTGVLDPQNLTVSGNTLFFSANDGTGYGLYATDGVPGNLHLIQEFTPSTGGSSPGGFISAGDGVIYFYADDGTGSNLWRSDGTTAGTIQVVAPPAGQTLFQSNIVTSPGEGLGGNFTGTSISGNDIGVNGVLVYITTDNTYGFEELWATNGTTNTLLQNLGSPDPEIGSQPVFLEEANGEVTITQRFVNWTGIPDVWVTDGTPGGTIFQQQPLNTSPPPPLLSSSSDGPPQYNLGSGTQISPGVIVYSSFEGQDGYTTPAIYESDGAQSSVQVIATIPNGTIISPFAVLGDKAYFTVESSDSTVQGLWVTDGTADGTQRVDVSLGSASEIPLALQSAGNKLLIMTGSDSLVTQEEDDGGQLGLVQLGQGTGVQYWLSDGTVAGTIQITPPAGLTGTAVFDTAFAPDTLHPDGLLLFQNGTQLWVVDELTNKSALVDPTGLPSGYTIPSPPTTVQYSTYVTSGAGFTGGTYFDGALYFSSTNGSQPAQLWEWTLPASTSPPVVPPVVPPVDPTVTSVVVDNGAAQRSMVTSLTVTFSRQVDLAAGAVSVTNTLTGQSIPLTINPQTINGVTVLSIGFTGPGVLGGSVPDGRYTLTVLAADVTDAATGEVMCGGPGASSSVNPLADVTDAATGGAMSSNSTTPFTRLFGDLTGDGSFDPAARIMVQDALGLTAWNPGYIAALDVNGDGVINETDVLAVVRNWGKSLPPITPVDPNVTSVVVNDGAVQRSMVTSITVTFNELVNLQPGAVSITSTAGQTILTTLDPQTVNGVTVLSIGFTGPGVIGGSVPDGRYTLTIQAAKVTNATGEGMQSNSYTSFTRLFGDLTGSGTYDRAARWMVQEALGATIGTSGYIAALDVNSDGVINETDVLAVVRNWGKSLLPVPVTTSPPVLPPVAPPVAPVAPPVVPPLPGAVSPPVVPPMVPPVTPPPVPPVAPPVVPPVVSPVMSSVTPSYEILAPVGSPAVTSVVINDGAVQRSMVTSITVTFNRPVDLADGAVSVVSSTGQTILLYLDQEIVNGVTVLTITFGGTGVIGGSVPDGRYTLTIHGAKVTDAATGATMQQRSVTPFSRLFGDLTGDGSYDRAARWMVQEALGATIGSPGYIAALDVNSDGVINETDVLAVVRNWGKSLPPPILYPL